MKIKGKESGKKRGMGRKRKEEKVKGRKGKEEARM